MGRNPSLHPPKIGWFMGLGLPHTTRVLLKQHHHGGRFSNITMVCLKVCFFLPFTNYTTQNTFSWRPDEPSANLFGSPVNFRYRSHIFLAICAMDAAPGSHIRCALQSTDRTHCWFCRKVLPNQLWWFHQATDFVVGLHVDRKCLGKAFQPRVAMRAHGTWSLVNGSMMVNASSCWPCWLVFGTVTSQGRVGAEPNSNRLPICLGLEDYFPRKIVQLSGVHLQVYWLLVVNVIQSDARRRLSWIMNPLN